MRRVAFAPIGLALCAAQGCALVLDWDEFGDQPGSGGAGGTGASPATTGASAGSAGGGAGGPVCDPGEERDCYDGPVETRDIGPCHGGHQSCDATGTWGACLDQTLPGIDWCGDSDDDDCDAEAEACTGAIAWSRIIGGFGVQSGMRANVGPAGEIVVAGSFEGFGDPGTGALMSAGGSDVIVVRYDGSGRPTWAERFGDAANQAATGVGVDQVGAVLVAGSFEGTLAFGPHVLVSAGGADGFVAKLSSLGEPVWAMRFGDGSDQWVRAAAIDSAGDVLIAGAFAGTLDPTAAPLSSAGDLDVFAAKIDSSGGWVWSKAWGDALAQDAASIAVSAKGDVAIAGKLEGAIDFGFGVHGADGTDGFVALLDSAGDPVFSRHVGGAQEQRATAVAFSPEGHVVAFSAFAGTTTLGASSAGGLDVLLTTFDARGTMLFIDSYGGAGDDEPSSVAVDASGALVVSGWTNGSLDFGASPVVATDGFDAFVAKLDGGGAHLWSLHAGGPSDQRAGSVAALPDGGLVATGWFGGSIDLDVTHPSLGAEDAFVVRLDP